MTSHEIAGLIEIASIEKDIHGTVYRQPPEHSSIHPALSSCSNRSLRHIRARVVASVVRWRASVGVPGSHD
jgi:hypothetical protein